MKCRQCQALEERFDPQRVTKSLNWYRKKGLFPATRIMIQAIRAEGIEGMTLIDVGGGGGAVQHELLEAGVARSTSVEASKAYVDAADAEASRRGYADRITNLHGDFVELAPDLSGADIVTLDRVVCCYPDMEALVGLSSAKAERIYALVYPRDTWWMKLLNALLYFPLWNDFAHFVHPTAAVDALIRASGFERRFHRDVGTWQVAVYRRVGSPR